MKIKTTMILGAASALFFAASASAQLQDVVTSTSGNVVENTFNNCVLTKWEGVAGCGIAAETRTVYFDFDSASLTPAGKAKLDVLADMIRAKGSVSARIVGYADVIGDSSYNQGLSLRRADKVADYLAASGVDISGASEVRGLGESSSRSQCNGIRGAELKACLWRDRRVEVELVSW
jgi:outer membrane protein OmpA-like peptidoglycan-associated protein